MQVGALVSEPIASESPLAETVMEQLDSVEHAPAAVELPVAVAVIEQLPDTQFPSAMDFPAAEVVIEPAAVPQSASAMLLFFAINLSVQAPLTAAIALLLSVAVALMLPPPEQEACAFDAPDAVAVTGHPFATTSALLLVCAVDFADAPFEACAVAELLPLAVALDVLESDASALASDLPEAFAFAVLDPMLPVSTCAVQVVPSPAICMTVAPGMVVLQDAEAAIADP